MTQRNIDAMDMIIDKISNGDTLSEALSKVYSKRNVHIPYTENNFDVKVADLHMSMRTTNSLMRSKLRTITDIIKYCENNRITTIKYFGDSSGIEVFETILNYCWSQMTEEEKIAFLIDTVERNEKNLII